MPKRLFCGLWMGIAASLVMPVWLFEPMLVPLNLAAGAIPGALLQSFAVGRQSDTSRAALAGMACAVLAVPLGAFLLFLVDDPQRFVGNPARAVRNLLDLSVLALMFLFWWLLPMGAIAGALLQRAWERREVRRAPRPETRLDTFD